MSVQLLSCDRQNVVGYWPKVAKHAPSMVSDDGTGQVEVEKLTVARRVPGRRPAAKARMSWNIATNRQCENERRGRFKLTFALRGFAADTAREKVADCGVNVNRIKMSGSREPDAAQVLRRRQNQGVSIDQAAITALNDAPNTGITVASVIPDDLRARNDNFYLQEQFLQGYQQQEHSPRTSGLSRRAIRRRVREALRRSAAPAIVVPRPERAQPYPPEIFASGSAATALARSQAWFGSLREDLAEWDTLPCPPSTSARTSYVMSRDGRGGALLALLLFAALVTMLVRAFV